MPAVPPHRTGTTEREWDGPAAVSAAPNDARVLRHMHAVRRAGADPDTKAAWSLPHHSPRLGSPAVLAGVRNALSRLPQTQGLSDEERRGAERHLQAHMDEAED